MLGAERRGNRSIEELMDRLEELSDDEVRELLEQEDATLMESPLDD